MTQNAPTVYLVDDDQQVLNALALNLREQGLRVRCCASAEQFLSVCDAAARGCAVIDMRLPGINGLGLQAEMEARGIDIPVLFLTGYASVKSAVRAVKQGAVDYLEKPVSAELLLARIGEALERDRRQSEESNASRGLQARIAGLTPRERQTIRLVAAGYTNKEIARHLGISFRTVEKYRAGAIRKLNVENPVELGRVARLLGHEVEAEDVGLG
ncbi:MAG: response regulator [Gammaproteobacteria bacterium]